MTKPQCPTCIGQESPHSVEIQNDGRWKCYECRTVFKKGTGRPGIGKSKAVKLTLRDEDWDWVQEVIMTGHAKSIPDLLRQLVENARSS